MTAAWKVAEERVRALWGEEDRLRAEYDRLPRWRWLKRRNLNERLVRLGYDIIYWQGVWHDAVERESGR